jgi:hypothetical protein
MENQCMSKLNALNPIEDENSIFPSYCEFVGIIHETLWLIPHNKTELLKGKIEF